jgi:uncharacterized protein GlcG (DUF336 family)
MSKSREQAMNNTYEKHSITFELAHQMVNVAAAKARELGIAQVIAVIDDTGYTKAFGRMDGAPLMCEEIAQSKAFTALFGMPTDQFFNMLKGEPSVATGLFHRPVSRHSAEDCRSGLMALWWEL